jgi:hypothetical protein
MYKLYKNFNGIDCFLSKVNDNGSISSIPFDPDNTDYQEYLAWISEGNTPEEADNV